MRKSLPVIISLWAIILLIACDDNKVESFDNQWKLANEAQFSKIVTDSKYKKIQSESTTGYIMYKVIESGDENNETPYFTDEVKVRYTGWFKNDWSKPDKYEDNQGNTITNKIIFDSTGKADSPARRLVVKEMIEGFRTALQNMKEGDKWEVWIPSNLAYGANNSSRIPAYTTLVFEIELVGIVRDEN